MSVLQARLRTAYARAARTRGIRRLIGGPQAHVRFHSALGAFAVRPAPRFAVREALGRPGTHRYRLRESGLALHVRHATGDAWVLDEVFNRGIYSPPPEVATMLAQLKRPLRMVDLGAHVGGVTLAWLARFPGSTLTAFEPNRQSVDLLRRTLSANGLEERCTLIEAAAGTAPGSAAMEGSSVLSHVVRPGEGTPEHVAAFAASFAADRHEITVVDAFAQLADADLVKLDIEGGEWALLTDPRFASCAISAVVLEYHELGAPGGRAREAMLELLGGAGFTVLPPFDERNGEGMAWAWREPGLRAPRSARP